MVIGDLGSAELADKHVRLRKTSDQDIHVCAPNYRPPDVTLGNQSFQEDLDMWSFGCVAAELYSRKPLIIAPAETAWEPASGKDYVDAIAAIVGRPGEAYVYSLRLASETTSTIPLASWLEQLPFFKKWYGQSGPAWLRASADPAKAWPPPCLDGCPEGLVQLVQKCLVWHPHGRMSIIEAKTHSFLQPPGQVPLHVRLATQPGKNGVGTIAEGNLDPDLLRYLQTCPSWNRLATERLKTGATMSKCVNAEEAALGHETEIAGIVDIFGAKGQHAPRCEAPSTVRTYRE